MYNGFVSGQQRPRSNCADAAADPGLHCPHIPRRHIFAMSRPKSRHKYVKIPTIKKHSFPEAPKEGVIRKKRGKKPQKTPYR